MRDLALLVLVVGILLAPAAWAENVVVDQAAKAGVKKCLPAIRRVSEFLIEDGDAGAHAVWSTKNADKQVFTAVVERNFADGVLLTSMTVSPIATGECAAVYEQVSYSPRSCIAVAKETFGNYDYKHSVNKSVVVLQMNDIHVYLLPAEGGGCVSIKKEVVMEASPTK